MDPNAYATQFAAQPPNAQQYAQPTYNPQQQQPTYNPQQQQPTQPTYNPQQQQPIQPTYNPQQQPVYGAPQPTYGQPPQQQPPYFGQPQPAQQQPQQTQQTGSFAPPPPGSPQQAQWLYKLVTRYIDLTNNVRPGILRLPPQQFQASALTAIDREMDILDMAVDELVAAAPMLAGATTTSGQNLLILAVLFGWDSVVSALGPTLFSNPDASGSTVMHYLASADDSQADQVQQWFFRIKAGMPMDLIYNSVRLANGAGARAIDIARKCTGVTNTFEIIFEDDDTGAFTEDATPLHSITWPQLLQYRVQKYGPPRVLGIRQVPETQYKLRWDGYPTRYAEWWVREQEYMTTCLQPGQQPFQTSPSPVPGAPPSVLQWSGHPINLAAEVPSEVIGSSWTEAAWPFIQNASDTAPWPAVPINSLCPEPPNPATREQIDAAAAASGIGSTARGPAPAPAR